MLGQGHWSRGRAAGWERDGSGTMADAITLLLILAERALFLGVLHNLFLKLQSL